jgi:sirohydrochlorin cobaltochelatase
MYHSGWTAEESCGLLVVGHGTREPEGLEEFWRLVGIVARLLPAASVRGAFLELAQPDVGLGLRELANEGVRVAAVVPLLLLAAGHAKRDLPAAMGEVAERLGFQRLIQAAHLGCHPQLVALSCQRCREAMTRASLPPGQRTVLLVGRGNRDPSAWEEMKDFARARRRVEVSGTSFQIAYLSMARPSFEEVARHVVQGPAGPVIVQPHLLFHGELFENLARQVERLAAQRADQHWLLAEPLGPAVPLALAIADRFLESLRSPDGDTGEG